MHSPHHHGPECPPHCTRERDLSETTPTGAYHIIARGPLYGNRRKDTKPRWWPFAFHAYKAAIQVATVLGLAWLAKRLGLTGAAP
jgi:hypothetical protein